MRRERIDAGRAGDDAGAMETPPRVERAPAGPAAPIQVPIGDLCSLNPVPDHLRIGAP